MDPRNWGHGNVSPRYGSYIQFDANDGSTPIIDMTQGNRNEVEGPFLNLLTGQGISQGWQNSQHFTGFTQSSTNVANMGFGGSSQYIEEPMEDPDIREGPGEEIRTGKKSIRTKNFTEKEDLLLILAWVNVSTDPVHGTNQSSATYWGRITAYFHEHKDFVSDRNQKSLNSRWTSIQEHVNKICGFLAQIERRNQSGATQQNKLADAMSLYEKMEKKKFTYLHCFNLLQHNPKWMATQSNKKQKSSAAASPASSPFGGNYVNLDEEAEDASKTSTPRPMGTKAAKSLRRRAASSSSTWNESVMKASTDSINSQIMENEHKRQEMLRDHHEKHEKGLQQRHETMLAMQREKIQMQKEIKQMELQQNERLRLAEIEEESKRRREEKRMEIESRELNMIMQLDLSKLDDEAKEYYTGRKKELLAKQRKGE